MGLGRVLSSDDVTLRVPAIKKNTLSKKDEKRVSLWARGFLCKSNIIKALSIQYC